MFLAADFEIVFASVAKENKFTQEIAHLGIKTQTIQSNDSSFDRWIAELKADYVIFDRFVIEEQFGWRIEDHSPQTVRILDTQDLHFLRRGRLKALESGKSLSEIKACEFELFSDDLWRELGSLYRSDCSLIISDFESDLLTQKFQIPEDLLFTSRFQYETPPLPLPFEERSDFVFIGNFRHAPNADGVMWLQSVIWPLIRKELPNVRVFIYGAYPPKTMMNLTDPESGFHVMGPTADQFQTLRKYRVNLAPLRFGAGIKGKISDGWWCGTPAVATEIAAEGMHAALPWGGEIALSAEDFAKKSVTLYTQQTCWESAQEKGLQILQALYHQKNNSTQLMTKLQDLKENLETQRRSNLTGSLLKYHLHRSTKYFSQWIEAKNKTDCT